VGLLFALARWRGSHRIQVFPKREAAILAPFSCVLGSTFDGNEAPKYSCRFSVNVYSRFGWERCRVTPVILKENVMTNPSKKEVSLGFIGLGNMGLPMAANLLKAGYQLRVYNRTANKAEPLIAGGAKSVSSPSDVIEPGGIVFTMLADDAAIESIAGSNSDFVDRFAGGGIHVSMSTIAPQTARDLAEHHAKGGVAYLAAPVIGRPDRAAAGDPRRWALRFCPE